MAVLCMRNASDHNYTNSSIIVDVAMGQIPHSTECISSYYYYYYYYYYYRSDCRMTEQ